MQIGETIRKYRKEKNMTQEEMAHRLGVTAPAVNKWENGNSYPDILMLAPIARLLDISLDTLLAFRSELTAEEIKNIIQEVDREFREKTYEEAFLAVKRWVEKYPNCEQLIWQMGLILDVQRMTKEIPGADNYDSFIVECYKRALESQNEDIRNSAADSLYGFYLRKDQYEEAEKYLEYFSKQNPERKRKLAAIYRQSGRITEAYKAYEELLLSNYQILSVIFHELYMLAYEEGNKEKAHMMVEKQSELAGLFEMGDYYVSSVRLEQATSEKDVEAVLDIAGKMFSSVGNIMSFREAPLYEHMAFIGDVSEEFLDNMRRNLLKCFRDEESYGFMSGDNRWLELLKAYE